ncbi:group II intron reverse transcriptase/maturase [Candidatus Tisiphia endosymbiont of Oplodontha viridula]|uniref:group II intron reverse transcriptase/maturase n=1 Tax=Candidatus Tisiphia endosymbiont of Oplodontha viridula TaxID=3077925 RepID=UPI003977DA62
MNWCQCNKVVKSHQMRIVKATKEGRWGKVKALQRLLTHSFSGKAIAVRRVIENRGKRTAGVDGEIWNTLELKSQAITNLRQHGYNPASLRRIYIPKANGQRRPLSIPTMKDRAMQALYKLALEPVAEITADRHSYGFRPERSTADAIHQCYIVLSTGKSAQWILEADIKGCFDNISHQWLLDNIPMDKTILKKWLKAGYMEAGNIYPTETGTPQGGIASPLLANMALDGLGKLLAKKFPIKISSRKPTHKINYIRYADDFVITGRSKEQLENLVLPIVEQFLQERGLELSKAKTRITHIDQGFDFLGQNVRKYNGKFLTKPSKTSLQTVIRKIRKVAKDNKMIKQVLLITMLNPIIRGWTLYHRHIVAKESFSKLRHEIFKILWRWAKRRHPNKSSSWVKHKYFKLINGDTWRFACEGVKPKSGEKPVIYKLVDPAKLPIKRHVKILSEANPYDKEWDGYFEKRLGHKMYNSLAGDQTLQKLWNKQEGKCPNCKQVITLETDWDIHHIIPKSKGGDNRNSNLMMLHINCHKQVHNPRFK